MRTLWKLLLCFSVLMVVALKGNLAAGEMQPFYLPENSPLNATKFETKANKMLRWIAKKSKYKLHPLPPVLFVDTSDMGYLYTYPVKTDDTGVMGAYLYNTGIMLLSKDFKWGRDDFILLHELVHHLQSTNEKEWVCMGKAEEEAYTLQAEWVTEHGIGQVPDPFTIMLIGSCTGER